MVGLHNSLLAMNRVNLTEPFISFEVFLASKGSNYSESKIFIYSLKYVIFITRGVGTGLNSHLNFFGSLTFKNAVLFSPRNY